MGENQKKILEAIQKNNQATISDLSKILRISTTSVEKNIAKLKQKGILKRVGPDKGGRWEVMDRASE